MNIQTISSSTFSGKRFRLRRPKSNIETRIKGGRVWTRGDNMGFLPDRINSIEPKPNGQIIYNTPNGVYVSKPFGSGREVTTPWGQKVQLFPFNEFGDSINAEIRFMQECKDSWGTPVLPKDIR